MFLNTLRYILGYGIDAPVKVKSVSALSAGESTLPVIFKDRSSFGLLIA